MLNLAPLAMGAGRNGPKEHRGHVATLAPAQVVHAMAKAHGQGTRNCSHAPRDRHNAGTATTGGGHGAATATGFDSCACSGKTVLYLVGME